MRPQLTREILEALTAGELTDLGRLVGDELARRGLTEGERLRNRLNEFGFVLQRQQEAAGVMRTGDALLRTMENVHDRVASFRQEYQRKRKEVQDLLDGLPKAV